MMLNQWEPEPETPNVGAVFPILAETVKMQEYAIELINKERADVELQPLVYDNNSLAQRYAEELLETGDFKTQPGTTEDHGEEY